MLTAPSPAPVPAVAASSWRALGRRPLRVAAVLAAVLALPAALAAPANAADPVLTWSPSAVIEPSGQFGTPYTIRALACPSVALCVAVDQHGDAITSTDPTGPASSWTRASLGGSDLGVQAIACPSTTLCVAIDPAGNIITSTDPTGGSAAWTLTPIPGAPQLTGISCASVNLCVAIDNAGNVATSADPAGGAAQWHVALADPGAALWNISCAATPHVLCAATDGDGNIATSSDPTGGASAWSVTQMGANRFNLISCASSTLCVGAVRHETGGGLSNEGDVFVSTDPTGGAGTWTAVFVEPTDNIADVSCASTTRCFAFDRYGNLFSSADPAGSAAWSKLETADPAFLNIVGFSCPSTSLCVGAAWNGAMFVGTAGPAPMRSLSVTLAGAPGGSVTGGGIACPGVCTSADAIGSSVTLVATAAAGERFSGWSGGGCSGTGACTVLLSGDVELSATFSPVVPATPVAGTGSAGATTAPSGAASIASLPPAPLINSVRIGASTASISFSRPAAGVRLQCSLVRRAPHRAAASFQACESTITFRHLHAGVYDLYVRALAADGSRSGETHRSIRVPHAGRSR